SAWHATRDETPGRNPESDIQGRCIMADPILPAGDDPDRIGDSDVNRAGQAVKPADPEVIREGADEEVHAGRTVPGGGWGAAERGGPPGEDTVVEDRPDRS